MSTKMNKIEPSSTEESVRPEQPVDYAKDQWELEQINAVVETPEILSDTLAEASYELYDIYTAALSNLLSSVDTSNLLHCADQLRMSVENIIIESLGRGDSYEKYVRELQIDQAGEKHQAKLCDEFTLDEYIL